MKRLPCSKGTRSGEITESGVAASRSSRSPDPFGRISEASSAVDYWPRSPYLDVPIYRSHLPHDEPPQALAPYQHRALETLLQSGLEKEDIPSVSRLGIEGLERVWRIWEREGKEGMNSLLSPIGELDPSLLEASLSDMSRKSLFMGNHCIPIY
jgi:hypothetical protein